MEFFEVLKERHSIREFRDKEIEEEKIKKILEAANSSPSAGDLQAYEIILVKDKRRKEELASAAWGQSFISDAPVVLVFLANPARSGVKYGRRGETLYCILDATIACAYAQLAATALGLGSCWVGAFDDDAVKRAVGAKPNMQPVGILPIGYPAESPRPTPRRNLNNLVHNEKL